MRFHRHWKHRFRHSKTICDDNWKWFVKDEMERNMLLVVHVENALIDFWNDKKGDSECFRCYLIVLKRMCFGQWMRKGWKWGDVFWKEWEIENVVVWTWFLGMLSGMESRIMSVGNLGNNVLQCLCRKAWDCVPFDIACESILKWFVE